MEMDSDTTYRMIVSLGVFIIGAIVTGILWPHKKSQHHYDSPLLRRITHPPTTPLEVEAPSLCESPLFETPVQIESHVVETESLCDNPVNERPTRYEKDVCLLCQWGDNFTENSAITSLLEMIDHYQGQMSNHELAEMVCLYYKDNIAKEGESHSLDRATIREHLHSNHTLNAKTYMADSVRMYQKIAAATKNSILLPTGHIDGNAFTLFQQTQNRLESLYRIVPGEYV